MGTNAYIQPSVYVGNFKYLRPNIETLISDKHIHPIIDSPIQKLNAGINTYNIYLPDELQSEGLVVWILNSSISKGVLVVWDSTSVHKITTIDASNLVQFICIGHEWFSFGGKESFENIVVNSGNYYTSKQIDNLFNAITYGDPDGDGLIIPPPDDIGVDLNDYYTKYQIDALTEMWVYGSNQHNNIITAPDGGKGSSLEDYYNITEVHNILNTIKYMSPSSDDTKDYYTKEEIVNNFFTKEEIMTLIDNITYAE